MTQLVSLSDIKDYLGETTTDYDAFLTMQIELISEAIEGYCGRVFGSATYIQTFYGDDYDQDKDARQVWLYHYPVTAVTSVQEIERGEDGSDINTRTFDSFEYRYRSDIGKIFKTTKDNYRQFWFTEYGYQSRLEITYTAGYSSIPKTIESVVYDLVEQRYNKKKAGIDISFGNDVQRVSIPGVMSIDFDYTLQANERSAKFGMILGNYANVLDPWRSERGLSGDIKEKYVS